MMRFHASFDQRTTEMFRPWSHFGTLRAAVERLASLNVLRFRPNDGGDRARATAPCSTNNPRSCPSGDGSRRPTSCAATTRWSEAWAAWGERSASCGARQVATSWTGNRKVRTQDLLVFYALSRFDSRPAFGELPRPIQLDVKAFFESYAKAAKRADDALFL